MHVNSGVWNRVYFYYQNVGQRASKIVMMEQLCPSGDNGCTNGYEQSFCFNAWSKWRIAAACRCTKNTTASLLRHLEYRLSAQVS